MSIKSELKKYVAEMKRRDEAQKRIDEINKRYNPPKGESSYKPIDLARLVKNAKTKK